MFKRIGKRKDGDIYEGVHEVGTPGGQETTKGRGQLELWRSGSAVPRDCPLPCHTSALGRVGRGEIRGELEKMIY